MTTPVRTAQLAQIAARASITQHSEGHDRSRLADDSHDLLNAVLWMLEDAGVPLPDPTSTETAHTAWA